MIINTFCGVSLQITRTYRFVYKVIYKVIIHFWQWRMIFHRYFQDDFYDEDLGFENFKYLTFLVIAGCYFIKRIRKNNRFLRLYIPESISAGFLLAFFLTLKSSSSSLIDMTRCTSLSGSNLLSNNSNSDPECEESSLSLYFCTYYNHTFESWVL